MRQNIERLKQNLGKTIVGKADAIRLVLVAVLSGGHALLEDVPGVGKTLLAKSLARSIDGKFQRIQCTPDLLPTDITVLIFGIRAAESLSFCPGQFLLMFCLPMKSIGRRRELSQLCWK